MARCWAKRGPTTETSAHVWHSIAPMFLIFSIFVAAEAVDLRGQYAAVRRAHTCAVTMASSVRDSVLQGCHSLLDVNPRYSLLSPQSPHTLCCVDPPRSINHARRSLTPPSIPTTTISVTAIHARPFNFTTHHQLSVCRYLAQTSGCDAGPALNQHMGKVPRRVSLAGTRLIVHKRGLALLAGVFLSRCIFTEHAMRC